MAKKEKMVSVKVCAKIRDEKLLVTFGYFDILPTESIDVTKDLTAIDRDDLERLIEEDDEFVITQVLIAPDRFMELQEELGMKLARIARVVTSDNVGDDF